ncbi:Tll0287-like domain-containing protein [Colwellia sp. 20A7]|uniref:Tll0287-like domain-containing protein n=1 Tax=Colwellia sp. 20A7 TaxID=2689569 RepID=UPI00135A618F|nr:DUF3365 domain-containing protein [Colwellia sp. 20A7]
MKSIAIKMLITNTVMTLMILPLFASANAVATNKTAPSQNALEARSLVKAFGSDLKSTLTTAMKTEGPIKALAVCNTDAGPIAKKHSALSNWTIGRTSTKFRNTNNAPDQWESTVLAQFEQRKAAGEDVSTMEYSAMVQSGDETVYRYMKPIPTAGGCLVCHGENINGNVADKINALYPHDQATGFKMGDIRGAFSLQKRSN